MKFVSMLIVMVILLTSCQSEEKEWIDIPVPADRTAVFPYLNNGNDGLLLSWIETVHDTMDILKLAMGDSKGFYSVTEVARGNDWFVNWADFPKVSQFKNGKYITHWLEKSTTSTYDYNIHIAIGDFGNIEPDTSFILHDDGIDAEHGFVSFLPLEDKMLTVWLDGRDTKRPDGTHGQMTLRSAIIDSKGNKSQDQQIDNRICDCCQTDLSMINGLPIVVYRDRSPEEVRDNYYAVYDNGKWSVGSPIHNDGWVIPGCPVNGPAIAGTGVKGAAAWYTESDNIGIVKVARLADNLNSFSEPVLEIDNVLGRVDLKMSENGTLFLIWMEKQADEGRLMFNVIDANGSVGIPQLIDIIDPSRNSGFPHVAILKSIVYISYTSSDDLKGVFTKSIDLNLTR